MYLMNTEAITLNKFHARKFKWLIRKVIHNERTDDSQGTWPCVPQAQDASRSREYTLVHAEAQLGGTERFCKSGLQPDQRLDGETVAVLEDDKVPGPKQLLRQSAHRGAGEPHPKRLRWAPKLNVLPATSMSCLRLMIATRLGRAVPNLNMLRGAGNPRLHTQSPISGAQNSLQKWTVTWPMTRQGKSSHT